MQLPETPTNAPVFMEDLPEEEQDVTGYAKYGAGKAITGMPHDSSSGLHKPCSNAPLILSVQSVLDCART